LEINTIFTAKKLDIPPLDQEPKEQAFVLWFEQVGITDVPLVGGKNASLGEMIRQLTAKGVNVPTGFATTAYAFRYFMEKAGLEARLRRLLADLDVENINNLRERGRQARTLILDTPFPPELEEAIINSYVQLSERYGVNVEMCERLTVDELQACLSRYSGVDVAVRSSATAEDLPDASFAGQQETYLNINGIDGVLEACHMCFASLFTDRFSEIFDGFSIGSNDLTQLTLGLDRDSALVSHLFDERDEAVKRKLERVIACAKQTNRKIGICGQAPSDYPEFAQFLVEQGIDSISLNPDSVLKTRLAIAKTEATILK
jgi:phosphoenolpyruvate synthase/pyruvate phosphate dikinase